MSDTARALSALCHLDPGMSIDQWHAAGRAAIAAGLTIDDIDAWSSAAPNYKGRRDVEMQFSKVTPDGGTTAATLFKMALDAGWQDPAKGLRQGQGPRQASRPTPKPKPPEKTAPRPNPAVSDLWARCEPASADHGYVVAKRGRPDGLRIVGAGDTATVAGQSVAGWLVVPVLSLDGELRTLQLIPPPGIGKKLNMPGAPFGDGLFVVGDAAKSARLYIVEGIGQAWAVHRATGCAAVVAFGAGRMATAAQALRARYPSLPLVVVPDRGKENQAAAIARAFGGAWIELPENTPANYDANDYAADYDDAALSELLANPKTPPMRYRVMRADEVVNAPPLHWLVRGVLPADGLAALFGASGSGKSFLALDLSAAVAGGLDWFECRVKAAPVVYVALEGEAGFSQRVKAWQLHHGRDLPGALRFVMQAFDLRNADDLGEIAAAVTAAGAAAGLLVIDTLNRAASGADENSVVDMGAIISAAKGLQSRLGGLVLLVHHSGKDASKGLRGHSSLHAALDSAIEVSRIDDRRDWRIAKAKDGDDGAAHPFKLERVEIGEHDDGEPITSCVVVAGEHKAEFRRVLPPKSGNMRVIWDALGELLRQAGDARPADAPDRLPLGRPAVTLDAAIEGTRERLACDAKRRTERAQQALTGLQAKGLILIDGGYVWIP
ncbi:MAG: AAA family ATPase [Rhodocyclales bacterium]|nr:AAA family ATPase [Rhodocyclales bacterium]